MLLLDDHFFTLVALIFHIDFFCRDSTSPIHDNFFIKVFLVSKAETVLVKQLILYPTNSVQTTDGHFSISSTDFGDPSLKYPKICYNEKGYKELYLYK